MTRFNEGCPASTLQLFKMPGVKSPAGTDEYQKEIISYSLLNERHVNPGHCPLEPGSE